MDLLALQLKIVLFQSVNKIDVIMGIDDTTGPPEGFEFLFITFQSILVVSQGIGLPELIAVDKGDYVV